MDKYIRIFHSTIELNEIESRYYIVLTEVCLLTNRILRTYSTRLPDWVAANDNPDYRYYQPILN